MTVEQIHLNSIARRKEAGVRSLVAQTQNPTNLLNLERKNDGISLIPIRITCQSVRIAVHTSQLQHPEPANRSLPKPRARNPLLLIRLDQSSLLADTTDRYRRGR